MRPVDLLCPSAPCEEGASLIGVVLKDGTVGHLQHPLTVDDEFVREASEGRTPEKRFRFSNTCRKSGCKQWEGGQCTVINRVIEMVSASPDTDGLPRCVLRSKCRWFDQAGKAACRACRYVVTDLS
jgi:hypothetical protein